jgi:dTDP-4-dehydrorhamnose 3,5-epimerase
MNLIESNLSGLYKVQPTPFTDDRGSFARIYCKKDFLSIGFNKEFVQINHSYNIFAGTVRGLHYQIPPFSDAKLIYCIQGSIFDIVVDIRENSSTFLQSYCIELSSENKLGIFVPEGFAHGFQTLQKNTLVVYHHTDYYSPDFEAGIRFDDPVLSIKWPLEVINMSDRDKSFQFIDNNFQSLKI